MSNPAFRGELRYVIRSTPAPQYGENMAVNTLVLQQAVDVGGPHENLHWRDVPTCKEADEKG